MHEINSVNKRRRAAKNFSNYIFSGVAIATLTILAVLAAQGYDIDRSTGQVIQNGILLVETQPEGADVQLNGVTEANKTPAKYPIPEGRYTLDISKDGYRNWRTDVLVPGSKVNWLYYPLLVPDVINTSPVAQLSSLNFVEYNNTRDQLLVHQSAQADELIVYDLGFNERIPARVQIPRSLFELSDEDAVLGRLGFESWSRNGRAVLLRYEHSSNRSDYMYVDLDQPAASYRLDQEFGRRFNSVQFASQNANDLIGLVDDEVFSIDARAQTISTPLARRVDAVYAANGRAWIARTNQVDSNFTLEIVGSIEGPLITEQSAVENVVLSRWEGAEVVAVQSANLVEIYRPSANPTPENTIVEKVLQLEGVQRIAASNDGRFVSAHAANQTLVYDLDTQRTYSLDVGELASLDWLDGYRFYFSDDDQLSIVDFDGSNRYAITSFNADHAVFIDERQRSLYSIGSSSVNNATQLRQSLLLAEQDDL